MVFIENNYEKSCIRSFNRFLNLFSWNLQAINIKLNLWCAGIEFESKVTLRNAFSFGELMKSFEKRCGKMKVILWKNDMFWVFIESSMKSVENRFQAKYYITYLGENRENCVKIVQNING
jgi:hypothetical protein